MADKSMVATAYAEVRADLSKLPNDLGPIPSLMKRMISTEGLKAVRDLVSGNISGGLASIATRTYTLQADRLAALSGVAADAAKEARAEAKAHEENAKALEKEAAAKERIAKAKPGGTEAAEAQRLRAMAAQSRGRGEAFGRSADSKEAVAKNLAAQSAGMARTGAAVGAKVGAVAAVGMLAIKAVAAVAAAYLAATVIAAQKASETLKTAQMVRATGEAAGWTSKQLEHMGEELRKTTKFSGGAIANAQAELLKRPNIKAGEFKAALDTAANLASVMGQDLPQAAAELGDLLADPIKAAEGGLEKYGILLNGVEQGQIRNAMAARDWQKAQQLVLGHLSKFNGMAKEAGETGAGGFEKLKNSLLEAAAKIGGLNGDIGAFAARVATAIDNFMELQIVKDVIGLVTLQWLDLSGAVNSFLEDNAADFQTWSDQISEIYHNVRDGIIQAWEFVKAAAKATLDFIMEAFGTSWGEIKAVVTAVLDEISLLTTDFGLTAKYVWVGIQLGAQELWDAIRDGLSTMVIAFEAAWKAVSKGAEAAWDQIEKAFTGEGGGKSIGQAMAEGFEEGLREGVAKANLGESEAAKKLKKELADIRGEMQAARDKVRDKRDAEAKRKEQQKRDLEKPGKGSDYVNTKPFKFEFVGFEEMSKRIQTSLYPTEAIQLQKAGVEAAQQAVNNGKDANKKLDAINDNIGRGLGFKP